MSRAAVGHMPFESHRTVADWDRPVTFSRPKALVAAAPPIPVVRVRAAVPIASKSKRPMTFDEQLEAVANGAKLVEVHPIRRADPCITLGGVTGEIV